VRPCRICPTCKRAVALQVNGTFYQHRDRNSGVQDDGRRRQCAWSGLQPPDGPDPMSEPRATVQRLREQLAAATKRAETAEAERDLAIAHDRQAYPTAWAYGQACAALEKQRERAETAEESVRLLREGVALIDQQRNETDDVTRAEFEAAMNELRTRAEATEASVTYWRGRTEAAWAHGDKLANDLVSAVFGDGGPAEFRRRWARIAELGEPETEYRFVLANGTESEFDVHNGPCACRREARLVYEGPWLAAGGWVGGPMPSRADVEAQDRPEK
jgi:hypothetical protein